LKKNKYHEGWAPFILTISIAIGFGICALFQSLEGLIVAMLLVIGCFAGFFLLGICSDSIKENSDDISASIGNQEAKS
jgi:fatty acid desaturase